jgi:hypothetical protein
VDLFIKVGGEGKPNFLRCKRTGILPIDTMVDGKRVQMRVPVRVIPGFGCNILPDRCADKKTQKGPERRNSKLAA